MDPFGSGEACGLLLRIMFLNAENKIHRIAKETNYIEIHLSNVKKNCDMLSFVSYIPS
jgi:hypothetical protein